MGPQCIPCFVAILPWFSRGLVLAGKRKNRRHEKRRSVINLKTRRYLIEFPDIYIEMTTYTQLTTVMRLVFTHKPTIYSVYTVFNVRKTKIQQCPSNTEVNFELEQVKLQSLSLSCLFKWSRKKIVLLLFYRNIHVQCILKRHCVRYSLWCSYQASFVTKTLQPVFR